MISYNESLEMENPWAMEFDEAPTLESKEKDSLDDMGVSSLKYHKNFAHLMPLQSQACFVPQAHMRTTTALSSSHAKLSES